MKESVAAADKHVGHATVTVILEDGTSLRQFVTMTRTRTNLGGERDSESASASASRSRSRYGSNGKKERTRLPNDDQVHQVCSKRMQVRYRLHHRLGVSSLLSKRLPANRSHIHGNAFNSIPLIHSNVKSSKIRVNTTSS